MRKISAISAVCILMLSGCLSEDSRSYLTEEQAFTNSQNLYINSVAFLYGYIGGSSESQGLQGTCRGVYDYNTMTTDEALIPIRGGDWYDGGLWENMYQHKWTEDDATLYQTWKYLYKMVMLCNQSLSDLEKYAHLATVEEIGQWTAEVRAIRALFYFYIMDMFGRVPVVTEVDIPVYEVVQSERSEVMRFVYDEMTAVLPYLANQRSNHIGRYYGRITKPVAWFLLAKLALNAEVYADDDWTDGIRPDGKDITFEVDGIEMNAWETCIEYCDKLHAFGYVLEPVYPDNFLVRNENSLENIFTIPLDNDLYRNQFWYLFRSRHYSHGGALGGASENGTCATLHTMNVYGYGTEEVDARFIYNFYAGEVFVDGNQVLLHTGEPLVYMPMEVKLNLTASPYEKTAGARMAKYEVDRKSYSDGRQPDNDIVLFRYADALLMKAEAQVRNGEDGNEAFNQVRSRVEMPMKEATLENIIDERLLELVWEGWRRNDMIRFGYFHKSYDMRTALPEEANAYTTVFPIPSRAIDLNPALKQNPGYKD
ncbi:MAG: RagB/SusD family nutrient uptake outer membrane protein [Bacteroidales bacterium]|nr:RagB/SusD family nutrient uptake outer membrane protein [Bacteroidales bacterium]